jgi:hypothetical protein
MADQKISQLTDYPTPLDADVLPVVDTANTTTKKTTWANIKATLKTYFDTLYQATLVSGTNIKTVGGTSLLGSGNVPGGGTGTVTTVSVATANGLAGTVATATTTPVITLSTGITGVLKGNGTAISAAVNSDLPAMSATVGGAVPTPPNNTTTFLRGDGTFATPAGAGTVTNTGGALTANAVVLGAGVNDTKVVAGIITDGASQLTLGVNTTTLGKVKMFGNTSGDVTVQPTAAAGTATVQTLPATTGTLVNRVTTANGVSASNSDGALTVTLGAITPNTVNGNTLTTGTGTITITGTKTLTVADTASVSGTNTGDNTVATALTGTPSITVATVTTTGNIELGNASDTTLARVSAGVVSIEGVNIDTVSGTQTLTNKRINPRIVSAASYTTDTGTSLDISTCDEFVVTAQAGALKLNNPSGTPVQGNKLLVRIKDNGTARALTYDTQFRAMGTALPSTTVLSKTMYMGFIYNSDDTKWDLVAAAQEA